MRSPNDGLTSATIRLPVVSDAATDDSKSDPDAPPAKHESCRLSNRKSYVKKFAQRCAARETQGKWHIQCKSERKEPTQL